jgi:hypothetical protein
MLYEIFEEIWKEDNIQEEWKEGHIVKLPKNGDLSEFGIYPGIMLLSAPGNVLNRILLERMKTSVDKKLRDMQAGFQDGRSCTNQTAVLRISSNSH